MAGPHQKRGLSWEPTTGHRQNQREKDEAGRALRQCVSHPELVASQRTLCQPRAQPGEARGALYQAKSTIAKHTLLMQRLNMSFG